MYFFIRYSFTFFPETQKASLENNFELLIDICSVNKCQDSMTHRLLFHLHLFLRLEISTYVIVVWFELNAFSKNNHSLSFNIKV